MNPHDEDDLNQIDDSQLDDLGDSSFDQDSLDEIGDDFGSEGEPAWGDDQDGNFEDGDGGEAAPKKKSSVLSYLLIGAVVIGAGGFGYMKFFANKAPSVTVDTATGEPLPPADRSSLTALRDQPGAQYMPTPTDAPAPATNAIKSSGGFMNAPAENQPPVPEPAPEDAAMPPADLPVPAPAPGLPQGGPSLTAVETPETPPADTLPPADKPAELAADPGVALLPGIKPTSDFPSVDLIKKAAPTAVETPVAPGNKPAVVPEIAPEPVAEIAPVPTLDIAPKPTPAGNEAASTEMQEKLTEAQSRIEALEKELEDAKAAALKADDRPFEKPTSVDPVKIERPSKPQSVKPVREAQPVKRIVRNDEEPTTKPILKSNWELRSAQPGQAMVSTKNGKGDIRTVFVGDTLAGVGRIVAITKTPSGWVVRGTTATLHQ